MIAGLGTDVRKVDPIVGTNDEDAALLPGVAFCRGLPLPGAQSTEGVPEHTRVECARQAALEARRRIRPEVRIDEKRVFDALRVTEIRRVFRTAVAYNHKFGAPSPDLRKCVTQLRDLFTTEQSAEVPNEREDHTPVAPLVTEPDRDAFGVEDRNRL